MGVGKDPHKTRETAGPEAGIRAALPALSPFFFHTLAGIDTRLRTTLIGLGFGPGWYYLSFPIPWRNINPLIPLYTHSAPPMAGGALCGESPGRSLRYPEGAANAG
jgi:hypothetical protein